MNHADDARRVHAERAAQVRERWGSSDAERMTRLAREFPSLAEADGLAPWHLESLLRWALDPALPAMAIHSVRFLLHVWSSDKDWAIEAVRADLCPAEGALRADHPLAQFNFADAFRDWDEDHRAGVIAWCETPFHPGP